MNAKRARVFYLLMLVGLLSLVSGVKAYATSPYKVGVYYFPGWTDGAPGLSYAYPWVPIKGYPDRKPLLGWYRDADPAVMRQQIKWMADYGVNFVLFDSYWKKDEPFLDQALQSYKRVKTGLGVSYGLLWANHFKFEGGWAGFDRLVNYWVEQHFLDPDYLKVDGKPVLFVFSVEDFANMAAALSVTPKYLVDKVNAAARLKGFPGVYMVGSTPGLAHWVKRVIPDSGFSAYSAYNYHVGYQGEAAKSVRRGRTYESMREVYRVNWRWILENGSLNYIVPMTSGWDDRPWGGAPGQQSPSTLKEFQEHMVDARTLMDAYPQKTMKMGVICCWNEFGEGSYVEPTVTEGFQRLQAIKSVFGKK